MDHSRPVPKRLVGEVDSFLDTAFTEGALAEKARLAALLFRRTEDECSTSSRSDASVRALRRMKEGVSALESQSTRGIDDAVQLAAAMVHVLFGLIEVLVALESASVQALADAVRRLESGSTVAVAELSRALRQREAETGGREARQLLGRIAGRLEAGAHRDERVVQALRAVRDGLVRPLPASLPGSLLDAGKARHRAHALGAAAAQQDGRGVVAAAKGLRAELESGAPSSEGATVRRRGQEVVQAARALLLVKGAAPERAEVAASCRSLYEALAEEASRQHEHQREVLRRRHLLHGRLVDVALRFSLIARGSHRSLTTSATTFVWPPKKKKQQQQQQQRPAQSPAQKQDQHLPVMGRCVICREEVRGRVVKAVNGTFHPDCFKCALCSRRIEVHEPFGPAPPGQGAFAVHCRDCAAGRGVTRPDVAPMKPSGGPCGRCGQPVEPRDHVRHEGRPYHPQCLHLTSEVKRPSRQSVKQQQQQQQQRTAPQGAVKPLLPSAAERNQPSKKVAVRFGECAECGDELGAESVMDQGREYHRACLCCCSCRQPLTANTGFFERNTLRYCRECYSQTLFRCHGCMQPLAAAGQGIQQGPHLYHSACVPQLSKPLPVAVDDDDDDDDEVAWQDSASPPPTPPPARPRWSLGDDYDDAGDDALDALMEDLLVGPDAARLSTKRPLMRTSTAPPPPARSSFDTGEPMETCWACQELNPAHANVCAHCSEPALTMPDTEYEWSMHDATDEVGITLPPPVDEGDSDDDQLNALILELNDI